MAANYNNKRVGKFRSQFEAKVAMSLELRGVKFEYEEVKVPYTRYYLPDMRLENGILIEVKGYFAAADRSKHLAVKRENPDLDIRFVFLNAKQKLGNGSKTSYGKWCDRHGFIWSEGSIPDDWIGA